MIEIDFETVDMHDVETLAMLIDDISEPDYSKTLYIIKLNNQFEEFLNLYSEINGGTFVQREVVSTNESFTKEFDADYGWQNVFDKEVDDDDYLPMMCRITYENSKISYPTISNSITKEYDYNEDADNMDVEEDPDVSRPNSEPAQPIDQDSDDDPEERVAQEDAPQVSNERKRSYGDAEMLKFLTMHTKTITTEMSTVLVRLENDFPQKMKRKRRMSRWAPVILNKTVKVGGRNLVSEDDEIEPFELPPGDDTGILRLKNRTKGAMHYYQAFLKGKNYILIEADHRVKTFKDFKYTNHYRSGRFHILCCDSEDSNSYNESIEIGEKMIQGDYSIE